MTTTAQWLESLPAFYVNLDRAPERREFMEMTWRDRVRSLTRVAGLDGLDTFTGPNESYAALVRRAADDEHDAQYDTPKERKAGDKMPGRYTFEMWKGKTGCRVGLTRALRAGIETTSPGEWMLIMEDDATPRDEYLADQMPALDETGVVLLGGLQMFSWELDAKAADAGKPHRWVKAPSAHVYGCHCFAIERDGAIALARRWDDFCGHADIGWWTILNKANAQLSVPQMVTQRRDWSYVLNRPLDTDPSRRIGKTSLPKNRPMPNGTRVWYQGRWAVISRQDRDDNYAVLHFDDEDEPRTTGFSKSRVFTEDEMRELSPEVFDDR